MANLDVVRACQTVGQAWQQYVEQVRSNFQDIVQNPTHWSDPSIVDLDGNPSIKWGSIYADPATGVTEYFPILSLNTGEPVAVRDILGSPGMVSSIATKTRTGYTLALITAKWEHLIRDFKAELVEALSLATASTPITDQVSDLTDTLITMVGYAVVTTENEVGFETDYLRVFDSDPWPGKRTDLIDPYLPMGSDLVVVSPDISKLVDALELIGDQEQEVSINQGAAAFSIRSRVMTP